MGKQLLLILDEDNVYVGQSELDREFFIDLKDAGLIQRASSFEDLPSKVNAQICVENQELNQEKIVVQIFTNESIPQGWKTATLKYLNRDLIGNWDGNDCIEVAFQLDLEYVTIVEKGVSIMIDIPV